MQNLHDIFPKAVAHYLERYGPPSDVNSLHGLSTNRVWRVCFSEISVVIKVNAQEALFYQHAAPHLKGVPIPQLIASIPNQGQHWLIMEYIPEPLPRTRWLADTDIMRILATLHQIPLVGIPHYEGLFQPKWDQAMTEQAASRFAASDRPALVRTLHDLSEQATPLFEPLCWISGDPNPANWGVRENGSAALFDWERFGKGTPALDLAISVPGLGNPSDFSKVARAYRQVAPHHADVTVRHLALAKAWTVVEFMANANGDQPGNSPMIDFLIENVPSWLATVCAPH